MKKAVKKSPAKKPAAKKPAKKALPPLKKVLLKSSFAWDDEDEEDFETITITSSDEDSLWDVSTKIEQEVILLDRVRSLLYQIEDEVSSPDGGNILWVAQDLLKEGLMELEDLCDDLFAYSRKQKGIIPPDF